MKLKKRVQEILIQIHRGFLTEAASAELSNKEILEMVPPNSRSPVPAGHPSLESDDRVMKLTPFTEKWVRKQLKKDPTMTAYDMLVNAGFKDKPNDP